MAAPVIDGVRMPDDARDLIVFRNGKFIRNSFIPGDSTVSIKLDEPKKIKTVMKLRRRGRSRNSVDDQQTLPNSVYYLPEDPLTLHSDRSPYNYEPSSARLVPQYIQERQGESGQSPGIMIASNDDFVIKEHTYKMCPDCPTFSIPIPIPKSASRDKVQQTENLMERGHSGEQNLFTKIKGFLEDAQSTIKKFINTELLSNKVTVEKRFSTFGNEITERQSGVSPMILAGIAAVGIGMATVLSVGGVASGRAFNSDEDILDSNINHLENIDYNANDVLCIPRNYCENLKRKKYLIDQFPVMKTVGVNIAEMIWDKDYISEKGSESWCNLRECVFSLLR